MGKTGEGRWRAGEPGDMFVKIQVVFLVALFPLLLFDEGLLINIEFPLNVCIAVFCFYN
jgi:hypothetical protein